MRFETPLRGAIISGGAAELGALADGCLVAYRYFCSMERRIHWFQKPNFTQGWISMAGLITQLGRRFPPFPIPQFGPDNPGRLRYPTGLYCACLVDFPDLPVRLFG